MMRTMCTPMCTRRRFTAPTLLSLLPTPQSWRPILLLLLLAACSSKTVSSDAEFDANQEIDLMRENEPPRTLHDIFTVTSQDQQRAAGGGSCPLSGRKKKKYCKKSCKSKSSPKCNKRKKRLKDCCDKNCDCEDDNNKNLDVPALIEKCAGIIGELPFPDIDVQKEKRRFRKYGGIFRKTIGRSYSFESRRGSGGVWGDWVEYEVVDGAFVTSLSDFDFFGFCNPVCKSWNIEDMFDAINVGYGNFPSNAFALYVDIVLYKVKYSRRKGFPRHLIISPIQVIPPEDPEVPDSLVDPKRSVAVEGDNTTLAGDLGLKLDLEVPTEELTGEVLVDRPSGDELVPTDLKLTTVEGLELDTCQPLEIQVRRVKALSTTTVP
mmetsp:Transcript_1122/g.1946  ORF Transcript_1122/g.1946 Transcript_1122/m.1946 type:complete len:377 (-) Transcript_1122:300-1430(-)